MEALAIELEVAGPELVLLVARYKQRPAARSQHTAHFAAIDAAIGDRSRVDWIDVDDVVPRTSREETTTPCLLDEMADDDEDDDGLDKKPAAVEPNDDHDDSAVTVEAQPVTLPDEPAVPVVPNEKSTGGPVETDNDPSPSTAETATKPKRVKVKQTPAKASSSATQTASSPNLPTEPILFCVCGSQHLKQHVFWIQCDGCDAWYNVFGGCVGFDEAAAAHLQEWRCGACGPAGGGGGECGIQKDETTAAGSGGSNGAAQQVTPQTKATKSSNKKRSATNNKEERPRKQQRRPIFSIGDYVEVTEHAWPGVNNPGGIARIVATKDGGRLYDIEYIVPRSKRRDVPAKYLTEHLF